MNAPQQPAQPSPGQPAPGPSGQGVAKPDPQQPDPQQPDPQRPEQIPARRGPVAVLTGAANGVGWALAERLYAGPYRLVATDLDGEALLRRAAAADFQTGGLRLEQLDVRDPAAWEALLDATVARWGRIDLLINCAGWFEPAWVHEAMPEQVDGHLDVNAKGVLLGTCLAARHMVRQGDGHVVNLASIAGIAPIPGMALHTASKFAVRGFSLAAARELRPHGVRVTLVCPDAGPTGPIEPWRGDRTAALSAGAPTLSLEGSRTVAEIADAIMRQALPRRPVELSLPRSHGWLAKLAGAFPMATGATLRLMRGIRKSGR